MRTERLLLIVLLAVLLAPRAEAAPPWTEGRDYVVITPPQPTNVAPGKIEVLEVFSYGCPACNAFQPTMARLEKSLPANAQVAYLPASFIPSEDWPMFQRAYFAAQALGIAARTQQDMYDAVWKSGELATSDPQTHRLKSPLPTIEDAARSYARWTGVKPEEFLAMARSFAVDMKMRAADAQIQAMQVLGTPSIVVNGHYRVNNDSVRSADQLIALVRYLIDKDSAH
ncbi:MAG: thiol:disulfide interchange protein DsbA/DsbL [Steroidobacteraceae bacterium]